jgi:hypothetical protein
MGCYSGINVDKVGCPPQHGWILNALYPVKDPDNPFLFYCLVSFARNSKKGTIMLRERWAVVPWAQAWGRIVCK